MKKFFAMSVLMFCLLLCACTNSTVATPETETKAVTSEELTSETGSTTVINVIELNPEMEPIQLFTAEDLGWEAWIDYVIAPNGNRFDLPDYGWTIHEKGGRCLLLLNGGREMWLCDQEEGLTKLSGDQLVINYTVAYDTVYWFNLDREVWAVDWYESTEAYLFCEDAIAVSPHSDEAEGAVVTPDRANIDFGYGLPIYSPYGE